MFVSNSNGPFRSICPRDKDRKRSEMLLEVRIGVQRPLYQDKSNNMYSKKFYSYFCSKPYFLVLKFFFLVFHFI